MDGQPGTTDWNNSGPLMVVLLGVGEEVIPDGIFFLLEGSLNIFSFVSFFSASFLVG